MFKRLSSYSAAALLALACFPSPQRVGAYELVREYSGVSFWDRWDFYGSWDNLTLGNVTWVDRDTAYSQKLAFVNGNNNAVMRVDSWSNVTRGEKRNSIRVTSQDTYGVGSLWIVDLLHLPYGCSVWPAFWTKGPTWPDNGEIDIIEQINMADTNQMALHSTPGCFQSVPMFQTGLSGGDFRTGSDCSTPSGCVVKEAAPNSYGAGFAQAGGGVWATQFDVAGVFIWFWSRANIPKSITEADKGNGAIDIRDFGPPSAAYEVNGCGISKFFTAQSLVFDITLCGNWAGLPSTYGPACSAKGPTGLCYDDNVVGNGANFADAYFELKYLRAYTTGGAGPTPTPAVPGASLARAHITATSAARPARLVAGDDSQGLGWIAGMLVMLGVSWGASMGLGWGMDGIAW